jgi:UDP-N-acetylmuramyl pentapeptide synthase
MLELGAQSEKLHQDIGKLSASCELAGLFAAGQFAEAVATGAADKGMDSKTIVTGSREDIVPELKNRLKPGDWVLIKGSRGMAMEKVVEALMLMS